MTDTVSILAEAFKDHQLGAAAPGTSLFEFMAKRLAAASPQGEGSSADWITHDGGPNPVPCGGCGETNPANRCVGCLHLFSVTEGVKP